MNLKCICAIFSSSPESTLESFLGIYVFCLLTLPFIGFTLRSHSYDVRLICTLFVIINFLSDRIIILIPNHYCDLTSRSHLS